MGKEEKSKSTEEIYAAPVENIVALTIAANQITADVSDTNPYEARNAVVQAKKKREILYKNGYTLPATAEALQAEAERDINHSQKLGRNMKSANPGMIRPPVTDAHHIVARDSWRAKPSREVLFSVGIGINDADNAACLPRFASKEVPSPPGATAHKGLHTTIYHLSVYDALLDTVEQTQSGIRKTLRSIKNRLLAGTFPFR